MNPYRFDLDKALAAWRRSLEHNRTFTADDLDELEQHLRDQVAGLMTEGLGEEAAFRKALREMGNYGTAEAEYRKVYWGKRRRRGELRNEFTWRMAMLKNYLKIAVRTMARQKGYSFINVAGLAVGLACCLLIGLYVRDELSYDRFHEHADRLYRVEKTIFSGDSEERSAYTSALHGPALVEDFYEVEAAVRFFTRSFVVGYEQKQLDGVRIVFVDPAVFEAFSFPVLEGDPTTMLAEPGSMVITASTRDRLFGQASPVGQTVTVENEEAFSVTGVIEVPDNSHFQYFDALVPFSMAWDDYSWLGNWGASSIRTYILLAEATSAKTLEAKLDAFAKRHKHSLGQGLSKTSLHLQALPDVRLRPQTAGDTGMIGIVYLFSGVALLVLLMACVNYVNLATARASERLREVGVRKVVGAHRRQLVGQFMGESIFLVCISLLVALLLAELALPFLNDLAEKSLSFDILEHGTTAVVLLGLGLLVGIGAGAYPAFYLSRFRSVQILKGPGATLRGTPLLRRVLVVSQFAASIVLVVGTLLIEKQLHFLTSKNLGFDGAQVVSIEQQGGNEDILQTFKQELQRIPQATHMARVGGQLGRVEWTMSIELVNVDPDAPKRRIKIMPADDDYLETMKMTLVAGRNFSSERAADSAAIIINQAAVRHLGFRLPEEVLGERYHIGPYRDVRVVGVVRNFHFVSLRERIEPLALVHDPSNTFSVVARLQPNDLPQAMDAIEATWNRLLPGWPFVYSFVDEEFDALYRAEQQTVTVFRWFAGFALFVAYLGLYGLAGFTTQQRTKEIGVRKVLGASVSSIIALLSKDFLQLVGLAFIVAVPVAYFIMQRWLDDFAYHIEISATIFLIAGLSALGIAILTVSHQAIKAALADPVKSLRYE